MILTELERYGFIQRGEVESIVTDIIEDMIVNEPNLLDMMRRGLRVNLMTTGMYLINRKDIGELRRVKDTHTIIEILTIEELYTFMSEYYKYIEQGQYSAIRTIMVYKLEEKMDDLYDDNYDIIFKDYQV